VRPHVRLAARAEIEHQQRDSGHKRDQRADPYDQQNQDFHRDFPVPAPPYGTVQYKSRCPTLQ